MKKLLTTSDAQKDLGLLVLRLWFGLALVFSHGWGKLFHFDDFTGSVSRLGLPLPVLFAALAVASELLGGLCLAAGFLTRLSAPGVIATMVVAAFVRHSADPFMKKEFALCYAIAALALLISGPGRYSVDEGLLWPRLSSAKRPSA